MGLVEQDPGALLHLCGRTCGGLEFSVGLGLVLLRFRGISLTL